MNANYLEETRFEWDDKHVRVVRLCVPNMRYDDIFISNKIIHDTRKFGCLTWNYCLAIAFSDRHVGLPHGTFVQDVPFILTN